MQKKTFYIPFLGLILAGMSFFFSATTVQAFPPLGLSIFADNQYPAQECDDELKLVNYKIYLTNHLTTQAVTVHLVITNLPAYQEIISYPPNFTPVYDWQGGITSLVADIYLDPTNSETIHFSARVTDVPPGGSFNTSVQATIPIYQLSASVAISDAPHIFVNGTNVSLQASIPTLFPAAGCCDGVTRFVHLGAYTTLEVDVDYCFFNTTFIMGAGSAIVVKNGTSGPSYLEMESCRLLGCDIMWKGIEVQDGNRLWLDYSSIKDAHQAVASYNAQLVVCIGNQFDRNYIGYFVPDLGFMQFTNTFTRGNTFQCSTPLKTNYNGQATTGPRSKAGMEVHRLNNLLVQPDGVPENFYLSKFKDLLNGIITTDCPQVRIVSSIFENMIPTYLSPGSHVDGIGVQCTNSTNLQVTGWGGELGNVESFKNCYVGISATNSGVRIADNLMLGMNSIGIELWACQAGIAVDHNFIDAGWEGIYTHDCHPTTGTINDNFVQMGYFPAIGNGASSVATAIRIDETVSNPANVNFDIHHNMVLLGDAPNGISFNTSSRNNIHDNDVYMDNPDFNRKGIYLGFGSNQNTVAQNHIFGVQTPNYPSSLSIGIVVNNAQSNTIECNDIYDTDWGINFMFNCASTVLRGNHLRGSQRIGLYLGVPWMPPSSDFSTTSLQFYNGNTWEGTFSDWGAFHHGADVASSRFWVWQPPLMPNQPSYMPPSVSPASGWFINTSPPSKDYTYVCRYQDPPPPREAGGHSADRNTEESLLDGVQLWPNPAASLLHIQAAQAIVQVRLLDMMGKQVVESQTAGGSECELHLPALPTGMYMVEIRLDNGRTQIEKVLIRQ